MAEQTSAAAAGFAALGAGLAQQQQPQRQAVREENQAPAMSGDQQAAMKEVARLRGEFLSTPSEQRDVLAQKISKLQRFGFGNGEKPKDFMPGDPLPPDTREYDPLRADFEAANAKPVEVEALSKDYAMRGLSVEVAKDVASFAKICGLPEVQAKNILGRALEVVGSKEDYQPASQGDYEKAARSFKGGTAELEAKSEQARRWLASKTAPSGKNVLEVLDRHGFTDSALALDAGLIVTLCAAAARDGIE